MELKPISAKKRKANPNVVYQMTTTFFQDIALCRATFETLKSHGYPIVFDYNSAEKDGPTQIVIRTNSPEIKEQAFLSALYEGLQAATHNQMQDENLLNLPEDDFERVALERTGQMMNNFLNSVGEEGLQTFKDYYSGLRWSTDQERLLDLIFESGTDYDESLLEANLSTSILIGVAHQLGIDYNRYNKWYDLEASQVLKENPDIDYRKLQDPEFVQTEEGQHLQKAYAKALGQELAQKYKRYPRTITSEGREISCPVIPLSHQPIIEALIIDEISIDKPRAKYDFGPSKLFDLIAHSDSNRAHQAIVSLLVTRLTHEDQGGMFYEGQDEFDHKAQIVRSLLRAYKDYTNNDSQRSLLGNDLRQVLEAYTGNGEVAATVKKGKNKYQNERDKRAIINIVGDLLTVLLTSPDADLAYKASEVIMQELGSQKALALETDPTALSRAELFLICLDSFDYVTDKTNLAVFNETVSTVFENPDIRSTIASLAKTKQRYETLRNQPNVLKALANWRRHNSAIDEKGKIEKEKAKADYEKEMRPANELAQQLRRKKNQFLLGIVRDAVNGSELSVPAIAAFDGLIKRIEFSNYDMTSIPQEYYQLMEIARLPNITSDQKNTIIWHIAEQFKYLHDNSEGLLLPVIIDIYELVLGPLDNVRMPDRNTSLGLAAATFIVRENRSMFRSATPEQLQTLASYGNEIKRLAKMILSNEYLTSGSQEDVENLGEPADPRAWHKERLYELQDVAIELQSISEYYKRYLHIQAVKVDPLIYYSWVLQKLLSFWQKIQREVGPGNRPTQDISELYRMMERYIKSKFVFTKEYPQDFDVFEAGHIDGFLVEFYDRVVTNHDINYNTTVWQEGQEFILNAVSNMPPVLLEKIINKHRGTPFAKWLQAEHKRWNKDQ